MCQALQITEDTGGLDQRTDILEEGAAIHLQAANIDIADLDIIVEGTPGIATEGARGRRGRHHRMTDMAHCRARTPGSEVHGAA